MVLDIEIHHLIAHLEIDVVIRCQRDWKHNVRYIQYERFQDFDTPHKNELSGYDMKCRVGVQ